jgi:hypothetical protein
MTSVVMTGRRTKSREILKAQFSAGATYHIVTGIHGWSQRGSVLVPAPFHDGSRGPEAPSRLGKIS